MERCRFHAAGCRAIPSSFVAQCEGRERPVALAANGTQFIYILDSSNLKYVGSVKFLSGVQYISCLQSLPPVALCCLNDGRILAIPIEELIAKLTAVKPKESDVFAALLEEDDNIDEQEGAYSPCRGLVDGEDVSVVLATYRNPLWSIQCATVYANMLLAFANVKTTGETILTISMSTACADIGSCSIPVFGRDVPAIQCSLSSRPCYSTGIHSTHRSQPCGMFKYCTVFAIAHCRLRKDSVCSGNTLLPLQEDLYLQLFGPECKLVNSPVLLTGSQNGHIFYSDLNILSGSGGYQWPLHLLYSLEQAVVAMHALALPTKVTPDDTLVVGSDKRTTEVNANALVFVGRKGKIVMCTAAEPNQSVANFTEFNVPGPILSSLLVPDQCLLYSTLDTIFEICLKPTCIKNCKGMTTGNSTSPVLIPGMAFRFPSRMMNFAGFLLEFIPSFSSTGGSESKTVHDRVVGMSLKGEVRSFSIVDRSDQATTMDSVSAAQELKHSLTAIQVTSEQIAATKQRLSRLNDSLAELNNALSLLCDVATVQLRNRATASSTVSDIASPFCCDLTPTFDKVGISGRRACIDVQVCYTGRKPLGVGWSLVIQLHYNDSTVPTLASNTVVGGDTEVMSQILPLTTMQGGSRIQTRVPVDASALRPLMCTVSCSLHYSTVNVVTELAQHVHSEQTGMSKAHGVTLPLSTEAFDALDFLQPFQESNRALIPNEKHPNFLFEPKPATFHQSTGQTPQQSLLHSLELSVPPDTTARLSPSVANGEEVSDSSLCTSILKALQPMIQRNPERIVIRTREREASSEIKLTAHDGSAVGLKVDCSWEETTASRVLRIILQAGSRRRLVEICGCIQRRLLKLEVLDSAQFPSSVTSPSHDQLRRVHWSLQRLSSEVASIQGELAVGQEDQKTVERLCHKTYLLYCRLREM